MSASPLPPEYRRDDWPRLVASRVNGHESRITTLEAGGGGGGGGISDGDKGDITVSGTGTVWTIDNGTVTLAKQASMATGSLVYRKTVGAGPPEVQTLATLKTDLGLSGTNTGDQTSVSGNAGTATALQTGRTISITGKATSAGGTFDGTGNLALNVTAVTLVAGDIPAIAQAQVTNLLTDLAAKQPLDAQLTDLAGLAYAGNATKVVRVNAGETGFELAAVSGGSSLAGLATVTVPNGRIEWSETVTATGVSGTSKIIAALAPAIDADENDPELLSLDALAGLPGTNQITFTLAFAEPSAGAVKINWSAF